MQKLLQLLSDAEEKTRINKQRLIIIALAILGALSVFMPWRTYFGERQTGFALGFFTVLVFFSFVVFIILCLIGDRTNTIIGKSKIVMYILGGYSIFIPFILIIDIATYTSEYGIEANDLFSSHFGAYLALFMGLTILAVLIISNILAKKQIITKENE
ncbi:MAG: hypothetical protein LBD23_19910 [Oscillospiraceae bacterium]|jgi:hypothetical protein|nr:hypothetical protein [Oscillospiraceae bacterium]